MIRTCIVNTDTGVVENAVAYETTPENPPPGFEGHYIAVAHDRADIGWLWDGSTLYNPNPPPVVPLDDVKRQLKAAIDIAAEAQRTLYITQGSGQALVYEAKRAEAALWHDAGEPSSPVAATFPWANERAVRLSVTIASVLAEWLAQANAWAAVGRAIEGTRESAKEAIGAAQDEAAAAAAFHAVVWPTPPNP
jgi:hypothetical protein